MSEKFMTDLYILANDVLRDLYQQRHGYKATFYYGFNHNLKFLACDGSDSQQARLLQQLADRGMFEVSREMPPDDIPEDFISSNVQRDRHGVVYCLTVNPDGFNDEFENLKRYNPDRLNIQSSSSLGTQLKINPNKLKVSPRSYDVINWTLVLGGSRWVIMEQPKRPTETKQAKLVRLLFDVKYFYAGVGLSKLYPVNDHKNKQAEVRKARSLVAEINRKLPPELQRQELIKFDGIKFYIHPQYRAK